MIAFLTLIYLAAIVVIFKVLKVKLGPWSIATTVVAGVLMIGSITVLWTIAGPLSTKAVVSRDVVKIVPYAKGQVTSGGRATACSSEYFYGAAGGPISAS